MALVIRGLRKAYGGQVALDGVDLTLTAGVVALLGANGSGKSTLLRILATLTPPDCGEIAFDNWRYPQDERQLRRQIGYLPQELDLPDRADAAPVSEPPCSTARRCGRSGGGVSTGGDCRSAVS